MKFAQQEYVKMIDAEMKKFHIPTKLKTPTPKEEITKNAGVEKKADDKKPADKEDTGMKASAQDIKDAKVQEEQAKKLMERGKMKEAGQYKSRAKDLRSGLTAKRRDENKKKVDKKKIF